MAKVTSKLKAKAKAKTKGAADAATSSLKNSAARSATPTTAPAPTAAPTASPSTTACAVAETPEEAPRTCRLCPRLATFIDEQRVKEPNWFNGPVPSFGSNKAKLLIVGLAPGLRGANRTGRPFTGDHAGDLLYGTLLEFGLASGKFEARPDDSLKLIDCMITNGVRCVPPGNKPTGAEINTCRSFLVARMTALPKLQAILALGRIAHETTLRGLGFKLKEFPFKHGAAHNLSSHWQSAGSNTPAAAQSSAPSPASPLPHRLGPGELILFDSYHCSRYNTNTGRLTTDMFRSVFKSIRNHLN